MGSERSSTTRQRLAGKICCNCSRLIDLGFWPGGERYCDRCGATRPVYLRFALVNGKWRVEFLNAGSLTPIGRPRTFTSEDKLRELIARTPTRMDLAAHQAIDYAIAAGQGGVNLTLTAEQFRRLG